MIKIKLSPTRYYLRSNNILKPEKELTEIILFHKFEIEPFSILTYSNCENSHPELFLDV